MHDDTPIEYRYESASNHHLVRLKRTFMCVYLSTQADTLIVKASLIAAKLATMDLRRIRAAEHKVFLADCAG